MKKMVIDTLYELNDKASDIATYDDIMDFLANKVSIGKFPGYLYNLLAYEENEKTTKRQYEMRKSA